MLVALLFALSIVECAVKGLRAASLWDDSYMWQRYASNLLATGKFSWNPGGSPTYGLTSLLFLVVSVPMRVLCGNRDVLAALMSGFTGGVLFLVAAAVLTWSVTRAFPRAGWWPLAIVLIPLALARDHVAVHFDTGMDTMFTLAYACLFLALAYHHAQTHSVASAIAVALAAGVAFLERPDLLVFTMLAPLGLIAFGPSRDRRRECTVLLGAVLVLMAIVAGCRAYFGTPVPLSFFVKGGHFYGPTVYHRFGHFAASDLKQFVTHYWLLFALAAYGVYSGRAGRLVGTADLDDRVQREIGLDRALAVAVVLYLVYYRFGVLFIMHGEQRFYYPALPALMCLSMRTVARHGEEFLSWASASMPRLPVKAALAVVGALCSLACVALFARVVQLLTHDKSLSETPLQVYHDRWSTYWMGLDTVSALPDTVSLASSEVGLSGALNPRKRITDLSGLNDPEIALKRSDDTTLMVARRPDVIYMPPSVYLEIDQAMEASPAFLAHYELIRCGPLGMDVAVLRDGPYVSQIESAVKSSLAWTNAHPPAHPAAHG